ncbi:PREDICTED: protein AHNAK2 [Cercocebus atys]|uniref:protein AHNAK2 n=1 Tax=Cercocebus atys TaxID=9531 RepID=UPI0005F4E465|nr:PREDICTED: protein AHNAK2 [Cercocebus atys]
MCDCFHMVLPTWPGTPGSVSGRQLQPREPDAETEDDHSVTEGPADEVIRPRPQGSSPVYEYTTEAADFGLQEDAPGRQGSAGRRRSWWKWDSGDSRTFFRMSRPESMQEATEVTLKTEVEAGASGYSVTGGGDKGIFVKQVLKDSSAAKLFNLREGDQLLSATVFFDNIKYEDALKILQYSEPYRVQFKIRRQLPAPQDEGWASSDDQHGPQGKEKEDTDVADGCRDTPTKTLEGDGDQERLISKPRVGRGRQTQRERLSWPKFQSIKSKRGPGPQRSHSSSEACEPRDAHDVSPTSTDTEAQLAVERQEQKAGPGSQRRRKFLNLRFRTGSGQGPSSTGEPGRGSQRGVGRAGVLEELGPWGDSLEDTGAATGSRREERAEQDREVTQLPTELGDPRACEGTPEEGGLRAARFHRKTLEGQAQETAVAQRKPRAQPTPGMSWEGEGEGLQSLEIGIARLSLRDTTEGGTQIGPPKIRVRVHDLKTPKFAFSTEKEPERERRISASQRGKRQDLSSKVGTGLNVEEVEGAGWEPGREPATYAEAQEGEGDGEGLQRTRITQEQDKVGEDREGQMRMPKFKIPSLGWSPSKQAKTGREKATQDTEQERAGEVIATANRREQGGTEAGLKDKEDRDSMTNETKLQLTHDQKPLKKEQILKEKDVATKDSKFKMPKFKMPSFGMSAPGKSMEASVDVSVPKVEADVSLPSMQGDLKTTDLSIQPPSADLEVQAVQVDMKLPEGHVPEGAGLKGHLPNVEMPSLKMPKVDLQGPQVDIKGPKLDLKGSKAEVTATDVEVSLPSLEVDPQTPEVKLDGMRLEGDLSLADKDMTAKDSKFKMPKFKMPSFGVSAPGKSMEASVDVSAPKVEADVSLPSMQGDLKTTDLSIQPPPADLEVQAGQVDVMLPEGHLPEEAGLKGHLPKVQIPSLKMPKVDLKGPQVDIKGPTLDLKGPKAEVMAPDVEVSLPSVEVDIQAPGAKLDDAQLEGELSLADKDVTAKDSKFKMPKFKMPSFGVSAPGKSIEASVDVSAPKVEETAPDMEVSLPSVEVDVQAPAAKLDGVGLEGDLSIAHKDVTAKDSMFKMPKFKMPSFGVSAPGKSIEASVDVSVPKVEADVSLPSMQGDLKTTDLSIQPLDLKSPKVQVTAPDVEVSRHSMEVEIQAPGAKLDDAQLEGELSLADKDVTTKHSKFKMPKFKMPSFGVSAPGKSIEASVDVSAPKVEADVSLPSMQGDLKTTDLSIQPPSADLEVQAVQVDMTLPEGHLPEGASVKGHLPKVQMPSLKMPKVDLKGPQVDIKGPTLDLKGPKAEVMTPDVDVSLPSVEVDIQAPGAKLDGARLEGELSLADKDVTAKDGKFKMPKFKMPSFGVSAPGKSIDASVDVSAPKVEADVSLVSMQGDLKTTDISIQPPSADLEVQAGQVDMTLPEAHLPEGAGVKGHLPKVEIPSFKMPKVDLKGPQVHIKGPKLDLKGPKAEVTAPDGERSLPSMEVDIQAPAAKLDGAGMEGDLSLADKDVTAKDSKFKMPKFKMPSFGLSAPGKSMEASVDVSAPKVDFKTTDISIQPPSTDLEVQAGQVDVRLLEGHLPEGAGIKGHLPKVEMPSFKMPKVDLKGPQVHIKGPKLDLKGSKVEETAPDMEVSLPSVEVDVQAPGAKLDGVGLEGDLSLAHKDVTAKDSKFKMPKFKMPSFGVSAPGKSIEASVDVSTPKVEAELSLPSMQGDLKTTDLSIQPPSADLQVQAVRVDMTLPEGYVPKGASLKGHLPKVQMPSFKMPKVDLKGPQVDIKGPTLDLKGPKAEVTAPVVEVSLPSVEVDMQAPGAKLDDARLEGDQSLADKDVTAKHSKFKMPKFKMPSLGVSAPGKSIEASVDVSVPKVEADVSLPSMQGDLKTTDLSIQPSSADLEVQAVQVDMTLPEAHLPEGAGVKGHLPKVEMPSFKMPKVDVKGPQVHIKGPKLDLKGPKAEVTAPDVEVSLPIMEVDIQAPATKLDGAGMEGDLSLADKDVTAKDGKFKMPKFKMPSFGVSAPGKSIEASVDVSVPKVEADVSLPSMQGDLKTTDLSIQPPADLEVQAVRVDVTLPEGHVPEGAGLKGHLPKVEMPSLKMPKVDLKGPQVDIKGPTLDLKGPKAEVTAPNVEVSLPSMEVDIQAPGAKLDHTRMEGDLTIADKDVTAKDGKFKMPKFKMPSFGVSAPGKSIDASVDVSAPKVEAVVSLPSMQGDLKTADLSIEPPSAELEVQAVQVDVKLPEGHVPEGAGLKGHLPKVQMPSFKMPKVDVKGPKLDLKGPKAEVMTPDVDVSLPSVEVDIQAAGVKLDVTRLEGELSLAEKDVTVKDSKFKMPKFKMPSFGVSAPGKSIEASVDVSAPKVEADVSLVSMQGDLKTTDISIQPPSTDLEVQAVQVDMTLPEAHLPEGAGVKGHLPKVEIPSFKMPKVDLKGPQVDVKGPKLDLKGPKAEVTAPDVEVSLPRVEVDIQVPGAKLDRTRMEEDLSVADKDLTTKDSKFKMPKFKMPSFGVSAPGKSIEASMDVSTPKVEAELSLPSIQGDLKTTDLSIEPPSTELEVQDVQVDMTLPEGHLPKGASLKGHLPKVQMPSFEMPKVDLKGPKLDLKGPKAEVTTPDVDVSLPSVEVDIRAPGAKLDGARLEGELSLADKDVTAKDSKFKMPKFKMPSFGVSTPGKSMEASVDVLKMPKVDLKGPQVDIKGPKLDLKGPKAEVTAPDVEVSLPSVEVDVQAPGVKLDGARLEGDLSLADKDVTAKDSKFKMPKFKMPSFGLSAPGKSMEASVDVSVPKVEADVSLPSMQGDLKTTDLSIQPSSAELEVQAVQLDVKLPEGHVPEGASLKGHLPKVQMPSFKMPKVDLKGPKLDLKSPKAEVMTPDVDVSLPSVEVDIQAPGAKLDGARLEGDLSLADKDVTVKDSKFKMPKFKMPSFGVSAPGKSIEPLVDMSVSKLEADVSLPSMQGDLKTTDLSIQSPSAELEIQAVQVDMKLPEGHMPEGASLKGHLPKVQMPSFKMPKVDLKGPQVDVKGPKLDLKGPKAEVTVPDVEVSLPSVEVDVQATGAKLDTRGLEGHLSLAEKDVTTKDSKSKMPKFKMPSFGVSPPAKSIEASVDVSVPKVEADVSLPSVQGDLKTSDLSFQPPSTNLEVQAGPVDVKLLEGHVPEGASLKGHLLKLQMPSFKGPQVDVTGRKLDLKSLKAEVMVPDVEVSLPSTEVDIQAPGAMFHGAGLEGDLSLVHEDLAAKDSKFQLQKLSTSGAECSSKKISVSSSEIKGNVTFREKTSAFPIVESVVREGDLHDPSCDSNLGLAVGEAGVDSKFKKLHFKMPKVSFSSAKTAKDSLVSGAESSVGLSMIPLSSSESPSCELQQVSGGSEPSMQMPEVGLTGFPSSRIDLTGPHFESSILSPCEGVTLTKYQVTVPRAALAPELALEIPSGSQAEFPLPKTECSADLQPPEGVPISETESHSGPLNSMIPVSLGQVSFPKFYKPKFVFSVPQMSVPEGDLHAAAGAPVMSPLSPGEGVQCPLPSTHLPSPGTSVSQGPEELVASLQTSVAVPGEAPSEDTDHEGKGSPFKMPKIKLPSFRWSPKKEAGPKVDPECSVEDSKLSLVLDKDEVAPQSAMHIDLPPERDGEKERSTKPGFAMPKLALPKMKASKSGVSLPQRDMDPSLSSVTAGGSFQDTEKASTDGGGVGLGATASATEGEGVNLPCPQVRIPSLGFAKPDLRSSKAKGQVSQSEADLPLPKHDLSTEGDSRGCGLGDVPTSQPCGEGIAPTPEDSLQPSCRKPDAEVPTVESPEEEATTRDSQESWFKMPKFRMPSLRHSSRDRGGAGKLEVAQTQAPAATGDEAAARIKEFLVSGSNMEASMSLQLPEADAEVTASESKSSTDVLRCDLDSTGLKLHLSTAGMTGDELSTSEVRIHPTKGPLPFQMPGMRLPETQVLPGEIDETPLSKPGHDLASMEDKTETWSSQPEGPLKLKASSTDMPSQISVVNMDQLWEDSVLTVKFPKLKVPRFSFPAPSSEDDVFIPTVREVQCPEANIDIALCKESPGLWGASILKAGAGVPREQPVELNLPLEASPISKVRVHIQGAQVESQEVTIHSIVTPEFVDLSAPRAFSTQIVRESEIPASEIQTPSYGFSLLKVKIPEPHTQARVYTTVTQHSRTQEGAEEAPTQAAPGADSISGDLQPDTGEPFEMISSSVNVLGQQTLTFELPSGHQLADSCSDEEPAEILEFPPDDSQEATTPLVDEGRAPKEKPESKKSGLLWFWLPNIGFSSSVDETGVDSKNDIQRSAPIQTQPEARPEAELPKKQEKAGWFRFPKLGFSSSPTKKSKSTEDEAELEEQKLQEETITFFDAQESFSPEEKEEGELVGPVSTGLDSRVTVTSAARTELILLEQDKKADDVGKGSVL